MNDKIGLIMHPNSRSPRHKLLTLSLAQRYCLQTLAVGVCLILTGVSVVLLFQLDLTSLFQCKGQSNITVTLDHTPFQNHESTPYFVPQCSAFSNDSEKFDCWPEDNAANQQQCEDRGCCWQVSDRLKTDGSPFCFYPSNYPGYNVTNLKQTNSSITADLVAFLPLKPFYTLKQLRLVVSYETRTRLRLRIFDPKSRRYEVPIKLFNSSQTVNVTDYVVTVQSNPFFSITIKRRATNATLFDTSSVAPLIFSNQYIQLGTHLATNHIFGLGEHRIKNFVLNTNWTKLVFWNRDQPPQENINLYGTHPFYVNLERDNKAHGVFLLNSNAMEVDLQPAPKGQASLTYRTLGGILDLFVVTGPSPDEAVQQYVQLIGTPFLPPFWTLGFHLCKYGYKNSSDIQSVIHRNRAAQMPYDTQWTDIDYMDGYRDWTYRKDNFSELPAIVDDLHSNGQHYVIIVDPGISNTQEAGTYLPYDLGHQMDIFMKTADGKELIGQVWPGNTAFPDFFHPNASMYWHKMIDDFHKQIPFDGLWTDMNEPSNFVDGSIAGCTSSPLDNPPFIPPGLDSGSLIAKVPCPSARQHVSTHYNLHNMYGWSEMQATMTALQKTLRKRSLVISRSTFVSSGVYGGHWTGDNQATWDDMAYSVPGILQFQLFGIPFVGADICGFNKPTTPELCTRWMQLGAFYPFMRNHNADPMDQDPAAFDTATQNRMRSILRIRYSLLPLLYTLLYQSHVTGSPVVRPLAFQYPGVLKEGQFLWGTSLLISPVLIQGATNVSAFIPNDVWYDFYTGTRLTEVNKTVILPAPLDTINIHVRGGSVLPMLPATTTTTALRLGKFQLLVAPDNGNRAAGDLFWDDGESLDTVKQNQYTLVSFVLSGTTLTTAAVKASYKPSSGVILDTVTVFGINTKPNTVTINGKDTPFTYDPNTKNLALADLSVDLTVNNTMVWT